MRSQHDAFPSIKLAGLGKAILVHHQLVAVRAHDPVLDLLHTTRVCSCLDEVLSHVVPGAQEGDLCVQMV